MRGEGEPRGEIRGSHGVKGLAMGSRVGSYTVWATMGGT